MALLYLAPPSPESLGLASRNLEQESACPMLEDLRRACRLGREDTAGLHQEYHALFRVPGPRYVAPYESAYQDTVQVEGETVRGALGGATTQELSRLYQVAGFEAATGLADLPDHAGMELGFAASLAAEEDARSARGDPEAASRMREARGRFLAAHPRQWFARLAVRIDTHAQYALYPALGRAARAWVEADAAQP